MEWRAFELHPGIPPEGQPVPWTPEQRATRGGNFARLADEAGLEQGVRTHWYNSTAAHEAALWAEDNGQGDAFRLAVFRAYFVDNHNIGSAEVLAGLAVDLSLDPEDLRAALADGRYRDRVQQEYRESREVGVTAVPTFVAENYAIVGAQPYEVFHRLMATVGQEPRALG